MMALGVEAHKARRLTLLAVVGVFPSIRDDVMQGCRSKSLGNETMGGRR